MGKALFVRNLWIYNLKRNSIYLPAWKEISQTSLKLPKCMFSKPRKAILSSHQRRGRNRNCQIDQKTRTKNKSHSFSSNVPTPRIYWQIPIIQGIQLLVPSLFKDDFVRMKHSSILWVHLVRLQSTWPKAKQINNKCKKYQSASEFRMTVLMATLYAYSWALKTKLNNRITKKKQSWTKK